MLLPLADAVGSQELWGAVAAMVASVGAGVTLGSKFVVKYVEKQQKAAERRETASEGFIRSVLESNEQGRANRILEIQNTRAQFVAALDENTARFTATIMKIEQGCNAQREADRQEREKDREQREKDRALIEHLAFGTGNWKLGDRDRRDAKKHPHTGD